jgi:hypothetical protein
VRTSGSPTGFLYTGGAHTTLAASTEAIDVNYNLARTVQFATGALTTQRAMYFSAPTYAFVGASTITNAYGMQIDQPVAGTNATITNPFALFVNGRLRVGSGNSGFIVRDNTSSSTNCAIYSTNITPSNLNHSIMFDGGTTRINAASSTVIMTVDSNAITSFAATGVSTSLTVAASIFNVTNASTSSSAAVSTLTMSSNGHAGQFGILIINSTTATAGTTQTFLSVNKTNIDATTAQELNIEYATRDNATSRASGTISYRYSNVTSGSQVTRFTFRTLTGGTTKNDSQIFDGYNAFFGGSTTPTARVHLAAGSATASTAPLKFTSGTNLSSIENGAVEFDGTNYYASANSIRYSAYLQARTATKTANYTTVASDVFIPVDTSGGAVTITLIAASSLPAGKNIIIKDVGGAGLTNNITINRGSTDTIDGATSISIVANYGVARLNCNGSNAWSVC